MSEWGNEDCRYCQECHARIESIERGKQLARHTCDLVDRTHPPQNHRGVHEGVNPCEPSQEVVAENANSEGDAYDAEGKQDMGDDAREEELAR